MFILLNTFSQSSTLVIVANAGLSSKSIFRPAFATVNNCLQKDTKSVVKNQNIFNKQYHIFLNSTSRD